MLTATMLAFAALAAPVTDPAVVESRARAAGFGETAQAIAAAARPAVEIERTREKTPLAVGSSKIGGSPDLPPTLKWPRCKGKAMAFLAQVQLAEIPPEIRGGLPAAGLLSFFLAVEEDGAGSRWWLWAGECGSVQLLSDTGLGRRRAPKAPPRMVLRQARVAFRPLLSIPDAGYRRLTAPLEAVQVSSRETDAYWKLRSGLMGGRPGFRFGHRLGGYADTIQEDPRMACPGGEAKPDAWRLLLQFDYDDGLGFEVADGGGARFYARADALARGRLGRICTTFDSG